MPVRDGDVTQPSQVGTQGFLVCHPVENSQMPAVRAHPREDTTEHITDLQHCVSND